MDRREALKKIAVGGAVAATGPVIMSRQAFAYTVPTVVGNPVISITTTSAHDATLSVTGYPPPSCRGSATGGSTGPTQVSLTHSINDGPFLTGTLVSKGSGNNWTTGDRVVVRAVARYTCVYPGDTAEACYLWEETLRPSGNNNSGPFVSFVPISGPTLVPCT